MFPRLFCMSEHWLIPKRHARSEINKILIRVIA